MALGLGALAGGLGAAVAAEGADPAGWKASAFLGVTLTRGNSETIMANANVVADKKWDRNEVGLGASATYGENDDERSAANAGAFAQYNRLFSDRFYGYARADIRHDDIAKIDYRLTLSPGAGYYFVKNQKISLSGEVGPGIVFERLDGDSRSYWTLRMGEKFTWQINERSRFWQMLDFSPKVDAWDDYVVTAEAGIETDITQHLGLRLVAQDNYRSEPAPGREENDFILMAGLSYKF